MEDGLLQFLVVGAFIVLSIIDGAARKRRAQQSTEVDSAASVRPPSTRIKGLANGDMWEEIAALARGEERHPTLPISYEQAGPASFEADEPPTSEYVRPHDEDPPDEHPIAPNVWREGGVLAPKPSGQRRNTARSWLGGAKGHSAASLRKAVVLHEILGQPVSLRGQEGTE
jgi:hypothetical protein